MLKMHNHNSLQKRLADFRQQPKGRSVAQFEESMLPYVEKSAKNKNRRLPKEITAHDLFSLFTANIIKQDVIFTR